MKTLLILSLAGASMLGVCGQDSPKSPTKSFAIFFYERPTGFANRTNKQASTYWQKWTAYIGGIQKSGVMESGSALLPPTQSVEIDARGQRPRNSHETCLSGYLVVRADSLTSAARWAKACPAIPDGGRVEVRELLPMNHHQGDQK
jgi:hypothetical protein